MVLVDPPIVLLDECTSALDAATANAVIGNLRRVLAGRTVVAVAHDHAVLDALGAERRIVLPSRYG